MLEAVQILASLMHEYAPALVHNPLPLLVVAGFTFCNGILFALTRGKEFSIMAYASVLFLVPFVRLF